MSETEKTENNVEAEGSIEKDEVKPKKLRSICVSIINNMPFIQTAFFETCMSLMFETSKSAQLAWMNVKTFPVDFARNWAVKWFLRAGGYKDIDWFAFLDIDMTFPKDALTRLLDSAEKHDAKVVTGVYFKKNYEHEVVAWSYDEFNNKIEPVIDGSMQRIEIMGMGCCIMHREVLEKVGYPWFKYGSLHEDVSILATEDIQFCQRAREVGYEMWCDTSVICGHLMTIENVNNHITVLSPTDEPMVGNMGRGV